MGEQVERHRTVHRYAEHGPAGMADVLRGLARRVRWRRLVERHDARLPLGLLALANGMASIGLMAAAAKLTHEPLVFPSLGPTAFLLFYRPHAEVSCPRNALAGHLIGALAGLVSLASFGLLHHGPALDHISSGRIGAAALSLGLTGAGMVWAGTPHPPAGATTLIISLGFLDTPLAVAILLVGVLLLLMQGFAVNRWAGIDYPLWRPRTRRRTSAATGQPAPTDRSTRPSRTPRRSARAMAYRIFVDAEGDPPLDEWGFARLRAALGERAAELSWAPHEWTAVVTVEAADLDEAADTVHAWVQAADGAARLPDWRFSCWEIHEQLVQVGDELPHWHPHLPHFRRAHAAPPRGTPS